MSIRFEDVCEQISGDSELPAVGVASKLRKGFARVVVV
jgi:hypothetical protein